MKTVIRIPTVQFGYIEFEFGDTRNGKELTFGDIVQIHNDVVEIYEGTKAKVQKLKDDNF